jgi:hypothetical protein
MPDTKAHYAAYRWKLKGALPLPHGGGVTGAGATADRRTDNILGILLVG